MCLPITSIIAVLCLIAGYILPDDLSLPSLIIFWIGIGLLIIVLSSSFTISDSDRIAPKYDDNFVLSTDPDIKLESTKKFESKFVRLSNGKTYVERWFFDEEDDEKHDDTQRYDMVLVHGFTQTLEWDPLIKSICKKQDSSQNDKISSILVYNHYGRRYSDAPFVPNTLQLFTQQLSELLMVFGIHKPIILVGLSMGGAIATGFAATFPYKIHKLVLLGPAGLPVHKPITARLATLPLIGELLMPFLSKSEVINAMKADFYQETEDSKIEMDRYENEMERWFRFHKKGANYSILSTLRYFPLGEMRHGYYERLYHDEEFDNCNWLFVWGEKDLTAPIENAQMFKDIKLVKVENANHMDVVAHYGVSKWFEEFWSWL